MEYVDLGLPSGTLWAKCNLGAEKESDFGLFYQWGDTQGYEDASEHQYNWDDYKYGSWDKLSKYNETDKKLILDNEDDPVFVATDGKMKSPTKEQLQELIDCTNHEWTAIEGISGIKFTNKKDAVKYIFIPATGYCYNGRHLDVGSWGGVWSTSRLGSDASYALYMGFDAGDVYMSSNLYRCLGYSVRGVVVPQAETFDEIDDTDDGKPVDLGLPSGTLWMKSNLGGDKPSDFGLFYQWADTEGYSGVDEHQFNWDDYKWGTFGNLTKYNNSDGKLVLDNDDDPVYVASSGQASMPTKDQLQELIDNTNHEWVRLENGVNGMKFINKNDDTQYIFIPTAGDCYYGSHDDVGSWGDVWSASRDESRAGSAWSMDFYAGYVGMYGGSRCNGYSVRGVINSKNI